MSCTSVSSSELKLVKLGLPQFLSLMIQSLALLIKASRTSSKVGAYSVNTKLKLSCRHLSNDLLGSISPIS